MTKEELLSLVFKNHEKLKRFEGMELVTKKWIEALEKVKGWKKD